MKVPQALPLFMVMNGSIHLSFRVRFHIPLAWRDQSQGDPCKKSVFQLDRLSQLLISQIFLKVDRSY
jgi:hypothetical protein